MKTVRLGFDVRLACARAWELIWASKLEARAKEKHPRWAGATYYTTANDMVNQVRAFASCHAEGKPWTDKVVYGKWFGSPVRLPFRLETVVRDWLFEQARNGKLEYHNFGRGHISGARFRPYGEPMGPSEIKTMVNNLKQRTDPKPKPKHYSKQGIHGRPLCTARQRSGFYSRPDPHVRTTKDLQEVTCPRCQKALALIAETGR